MTATSQAPPSDPVPPATGLYVFGVTRAAAPRSTGPGLSPDTELGRLEDDGLAAVLCPVALGEWTGPDAESRFRDLSWLGPRAMRHQAVIEQVMAAAPVLPLRFGSLFSSEASVRAWLRTGAAAIRTFLQDSEQLQEWSLKGWLDVPRAEAARLAVDPRYLALPAARGARYLLEQKLRQDIAKSVRSWARGVEQQLLTELRPLLHRHRTLRSLSGEVSGRTDEVMFHQALLVPTGRHQELDEQVARLATELEAQGLALELTGPWPLYSFVPTLLPTSAEPADSTGIPEASGD